MTLCLKKGGDKSQSIQGARDTEDPPPQRISPGLSLMHQGRNACSSTRDGLLSMQQEWTGHPCTRVGLLILHPGQELCEREVLTMSLLHELSVKETQFNHLTNMINSL